MPYYLQLSAYKFSSFSYYFQVTVYSFSVYVIRPSYLSVDRDSIYVTTDGLLFFGTILLFIFFLLQHHFIFLYSYSYTANIIAVSLPFMDYSKIFFLSQYLISLSFFKQSNTCVSSFITLFLSLPICLTFFSLSISPNLFFSLYLYFSIFVS